MSEMAAFDELSRQLAGLREKVGRLEEKNRHTGATTIAGLAVPAAAFASLPSAPRTYQVYFITDKTVPGGSYAGVLAVYNGTRWIGPDGGDVAGY